MRFATLKIGDRVRMTAKAVSMGLAGPHGRSVGTVVGYSRRWPGLVRVKRRGAKRAITYAPYLWQKVKGGAVGRAVDGTPAEALEVASR